MSDENPFKKQRIFSKASTIHCHDIYMDGSLGPPEDYREEYELIRNLGPGDTVIMRYNGNGGYVSTAIQFVKCFAETAGTVISSMEGDCASAHSMMYLSGHGFEVSPYTNLMCHNYSGGVVGTGHEIWTEAQHQKAWSDDLIKGIYQGFLTDTELELMLNGKPYYFTPDEVIDRCTKMIEYKEALVEKELDEGECCGECDSGDEDTDTGELLFCKGLVLNPLGGGFWDVWELGDDDKLLILRFDEEKSDFVPGYGDREEFILALDLAEVEFSLKDSTKRLKKKIIVLLEEITQEGNKHE